MVNAQTEGHSSNQSHSTNGNYILNNYSVTKSSFDTFNNNNKDQLSNKQISDTSNGQTTTTTTNSDVISINNITTATSPVTKTADTEFKVKKTIAKKQNRNRLSFVCQACRRSKTKCDREKPKCTRCEKMNLDCVYDVAKQPRPRIPNKDATIAKLEKDVAYWQSKAMKLLNQQQEIMSSLRDKVRSNDGNKNNNNNTSLPGKGLIMNSNEYTLSIDNDPVNLSFDVSKNLPPLQMTRNIDDNDNDDKLRDIEINLYKDHPTMILSKVMKHDE